MKRAVFLLLLTAFCFWGSSVFAQRVTVLKKQGGTLGHISVGCGHPVTDWKKLKEFNPELPNPTRLQNGRFDVRIFEGNSVFVPDDWDCSKLSPSLGVVTARSLPEEKLAPEGMTAGDEQREDRRHSLWFLSSLGEWTVPLLSLLLAIGIILFLYWVIPTIYWWLTRRNPARYPSVIPGGLSGDLETATRQIEGAYPGRQYRRIERGYVIRDHGPKRILVRRMTFGDGIPRSVYVSSGNEVYRGTLSNSTEEYYLRPCGNLGAEFNLPQGWRFVASASRDIPQSTAQDQPVSVPTEPAEQPVVPAETSIPAEKTVTPATSQNHQGFITIRVFDELGRVLMEIDGENPSIQVERGPQGTKVSRRGQ